MPRAVAAFHTVSHWDTISLHPHCMTDLYGRFLLLCDAHDGPGRTHLRAAGAFRTAISTLVGRFGLHKCLEVGRRAEHAVGTLRHAQLTCSAVLTEMPQTFGTRRHDACGTCRHFLVLNHGQTAVHNLFLRLHSCGRSGHGSSCQECAACGINRSGRFLSDALMAVCVAYGMLMTLVNAIHARHAT